MCRSPQGPYKLESIQKQYNTNWQSNLVPWEKRWGRAQGGLPGGQAERGQVFPTDGDGEDFDGDGDDDGDNDGEDDGEDGGEDNYGGKDVK